MLFYDTDMSISNGFSAQLPETRVSYFGFGFETSLLYSLPCLVDKYLTRNPSLICEQIGPLVIVFTIFQKPSCQDVSDSISDEQSSISSIPTNTTDLFQDALVNYYSHLMNQVHQNIVQMGILRVLQNQQGK